MRQTDARWFWLVSSAALILGCGGGSSGSSNGDGAAGAPGSNGLLSCDIRPACGGKSSEHICIASTGYGKVAGDSTGTVNNCTVASGNLGSTCDLTGVVAGCRGVGAGAGDYITFTYWYYAGTVADVTAKCPSPMTVVFPDAGSVTDGGAGQSTGCPDAGAGGGGGGGGDGGPGGVVSRGPLMGVTAMSAGGDDGCAIIAGGKVVCWGVMGTVLGDVLLPGSGLPEPILIPGVTGATAISVGGTLGQDYACVILQGGTVSCWGDEALATLGRGDSASGASGLPGYPAAVQGLTGVSGISAGDGLACAVAGGQVWCWGDNSWDQLGYAGNPSSSSVPVKIAGLSNVTAISASGRHACALSGGTAWCWGENTYSESGAARTAAGSDRIPTPTQVASLTGVTSVSATPNASYAVLSDGTVWCWGSCVGSPLTGTLTPVKVAGFSDAVAVNVGMGPSCAVQKGGTAQCPSAPTAVAGLTGVKAVSGAGGFTCLLVNDGVECWGRNDNGQLGNGALATNLGGGATQLTVTPSPVVALGPCCGGGDYSFSTGLPGTTEVADLSPADFQTLCSKARGDTDGLDQYCKIFAVGSTMSAPATATDADLRSACQMSYDSCFTVIPQYSPSTCSKVTASVACTVRVDEVEACLNEQTALGRANGPLLPACSALTRSMLDAVPVSLIVQPPSCQATGTCNQIFVSPP